MAWQILRRVRLLGTLRGRRRGLWEEQRGFGREAVARFISQFEDFSQRMGMGEHTRGSINGVDRCYDECCHFAPEVCDFALSELCSHPYTKYRLWFVK
jgi:hypothetical protein